VAGFAFECGVLPLYIKCYGSAEAVTSNLPMQLAAMSYFNGNASLNLCYAVGKTLIHCFKIEKRESTV